MENIFANKATDMPTTHAAQKKKNKQKKNQKQKPKPPNKKWSKDLNRHVFKQMASQNI